jgi:hypothetical protein
VLLSISLTLSPSLFCVKIWCVSLTWIQSLGDITDQSLDVDFLSRYRLLHHGVEITKYPKPTQLYSLKPRDGLKLTSEPEFEV